MPTIRSIRMLYLAAALLAGLTSCSTPEGPSVTWTLTGTVWKVAEIGGEMVGAKIIPTLQLETGGQRVIAFGGINRITGTYRLEGSALSFGPLAATRMAGPAEQLQAEAKLQQVLGTVTNYRIKGPWLVLLAGEKIVARAQGTSAFPFPSP